MVRPESRPQGSANADRQPRSAGAGSVAHPRVGRADRYGEVEDIEPCAARICPAGARGRDARTGDPGGLDARGSRSRDRSREEKIEITRPRPYGKGLSSTELVLRPPLLALAAITTAQAFLASVIVADVFGAINANLRGRFPADVACKGKGLRHSYFPFVFRFAGAGAGAGAGWRFCCSRQRCASRSTTANSCSFCAARSVMYCRN